MEKQVVLISGGSRGLGAELATFYLQKGYKVAVFSRSITDYITSIQQSDEYKDRFIWCKASLADNTSLKNCFKQVIEAFGRVDILINNAAIMKEGILMSMKDKDIEEMIDSNLTGTFQITKLCLKSMTCSGQGAIVFISSIVGATGVQGLSVYSATKSAIEGLVRSLTREYSSHHIRINAVAPGYLNTEMTNQMPEQRVKRIIKKTPLGRLGTTRDIAKVVYFLTSPDASFITGQTITVDGGYTA